ncbi:MAG: acetolactate synthase small subunit [Candidatus Omnitrophica bacterium]|nr:acetolactate synthase small subunit [Candidatus Omnitrophota bacterium]
MAKKKKDIHTISVKVANKPGVLLRCAQVFARRGYNIDSLVVSAGVNPKYSRMTITAQGDPETLEQIIKQTAKLVDVLHCEEHTGADSVTREVALLKLKSSAQIKSAITKHKRKYGLKIVDEGEGAIIIEQDGTTEELDEFEELMKKHGIIEMVRSGKLVMALGKEPT